MNAVPTQAGGGAPGGGAKAVVRHLMWVLRTELRKGVRAPKHHAISLAPSYVGFVWLVDLVLLLVVVSCFIFILLLLF